MSGYFFPLAVDALLAAALLLAAATLPGARRLVAPSVVMTALFCLLMLAGLVARGLDSNQWPLVSRFEFLLWFALATAGMYLLLVGFGHPPSIGIVVLPLAAAIAVYALFSGPAAERTVTPAPPVLRSIWLQVHVLAAAAGYGAGAVAGALGLVIIGLHASDRAGAGALDRRDAAAAMDVAVDIAFPCLSLALLSGAIWAQAAWGRYWSWYPKEIWALVTWLVFLTALHARCLRGWRGWRLAGLSAAGLFCILFTLLGVGWLARLTGVVAMPVF